MMQQIFENLDSYEGMELAFWCKKFQQPTLKPPSTLGNATWEEQKKAAD